MTVDKPASAGSAAATRLPANYIVDENGVKKLGPEVYAQAKYPEWLPTWDPNDTFPAFKEDRTFVDRGLFGDPSYKNLFPKSKDIEKFDITPNFGVEVRSGVQLSQLTSEGKDDLALLLAQKGFAVFRNQDLKDKGLEFNRQFGEHFGPLHVHTFSGAPLNYPNFHIVYRNGDEKFNEDKVISPHIDCNWEPNSVGVTIFAILDGPSTGGDTLFFDSQEVYKRLSTKFKKSLEGYSCIHSNIVAANINGKINNFIRTPPAENSHPLVKVHPVTKKKSIFFSYKFTESIEGLKPDEAKLILEFLRHKIMSQPDLHVRARWEPGTVVLWDNRRVLHSPVADFEDAPRHCYRLSTFAEVPVENFEELEPNVQELATQFEAKLNLAHN